MSISSWLRREFSFPQWMSPPQWMRKQQDFFGHFLAVLSTSVQQRSACRPHLAAYVGGIALATKSRKVWLDVFVLEGRVAQLFVGSWFVAGLTLCIKHYF